MVLPIVLSEHRSDMHDMLSQYKKSASASVRDIQATRLAALLAVFVANHSGCIGEWDFAVPVPSTERTAIKSILNRTLRFKDGTDYGLLVATDQKSRAFNESQFEVHGNVSGDRVLLIDDTFASGGSLLSAHHALSAAGATVLGPLVIGRHVNIADWPPSDAMMKWLRSRRWDETRCCRCAGEMRDPNALL